MSQAVAPTADGELRVSRMPPGAEEWIVRASTPMRMKDACALILCEGHNNALSRADREAGRVARAAQAALASRADHNIEVDGPLFTRWMCKVACGVAAVTGHEQRAGSLAHPDLIRYAFGRRTETPVHFFSADGRRAPWVYREALTVQSWRVQPGYPEAYHVGLYTLDLIVSTLPGDAPEMRDVFERCPGTRFKLMLLDTVRT